MDSEKGLASPPSAPPSFQSISSVVGSSPAPPQTIPIKYSPAPSPEGNMPLPIFGQTYQKAGGFLNMHNVPAFGPFTSSTNCSKFVDQGNLGLSMLSKHPQLKGFPELRQPTEIENHRAATLFQPPLGLHPFLPAFRTQNPADSPLCTSGLNGWSSSSPNYNLSISPLLGKDKKRNIQSTSTLCQMSLSEQLQHENIILPKKEMDLMKTHLEASRLNGCLSGFLSESSSEEVSSDSDNTEKDEDLSSNSDDSEKEILVKKKHLTHNTSESKERGPFAGEGNTCQKSLCHSVPVTSFDWLRSYSHPSDLPTCAAPVRHSAKKKQHHTSVMHPTGLAINNISLKKSHSEACPSLSKPVPTPDLSKYKSTPMPSKHQMPSLSPNQSSISKHLPAGLLKPLITKQYTMLASKDSLMPQSKTAQPVDQMNKSNKVSAHVELLHQKKNKLQKATHLIDSVKKTSSGRHKNQLCDSKQFLNPHPNRVITNAVQDVPLALIAKPWSQTNVPNSRPFLAPTNPPHLTPINLSTGTIKASHTFASPPKSSAPSGLVPGSIKAASVLHGGWRPVKTGLCHEPVDLTRRNGFNFHSCKASESSEDNADEDEDEDEEENSVNNDSGSNLSDSESNPDSDGASDHRKECFKAEPHTDAERSALKPAETSPPSLNLSPGCYRKVTKPSGLPSTISMNQNGHLLPLQFTATPGPKKRRRVTDETLLQLPLKFGWQRETRIRTVAGRLQAEVAYFAPCGKKLRQFPDVVKYLIRHGITGISRDNFSFSTKIKVGNFYKDREGPKGLQWILMAENEIASCITAIDGRRSRQTKCKHQSAASVTGAKSHPVNCSEPHLQVVADAKLIRKLKAQEMARQAAQLKIMNKLEKQAIAQATKEAKKQKAIMAAEERRKKREELKIFRQEKLKHIQHIRIERELRAQQVLEAKRKKKEVAVNVKMLEAEKRKKEKDIRKLQSVIQKHQERERHRQHMILMKVVETQKKAEEKERLKKEKKEEKLLKRKKKLELRRQELMKAKELRKPKEDMCLADHKPLPELSHIPGLILPGKTFSDCLMVLQFVHNFGAVLKVGLSSNQLTISNLQDWLLGIGNGVEKLQDLLVGMVSAAVCDPGIPAGHKCKTLLGDNLTTVEINRDNVSEILQIYMEAHSEQTEVADLAHSLQTKAFQAHSPSQKADMLAFLVNKLCSSKAVISKIDKNIDYMTNLRKDKWVLEGKLRKLRTMHGNLKEKRYSNIEEKPTLSSLFFQNKLKRKNRDSEEEEQDEDSEDQGNNFDEEVEKSRENERKRAEMCEEEEAATHLADLNELETKIQKICKLQSEINQKLFEASHSLRSMMVGEDRYRRRYWLLPQCGGIFIEGVENGFEGEEKESGRQRGSVKVKEQQDEISEQTTENAETKRECNDPILLQKSVSKLNKLLEAAKTNQDSNTQKTYPTDVSITEPHHSYCAPQTVSSMHSAAQSNNNCMTCSPQSVLPYAQLSTALTEKGRKWFSLVPHSPCDSSSVISNTSRPAFFSSSQLLRTKASSFVFPETPRNTLINSLQSAVTQQVKSGIHRSNLTLCDMFSLATSFSLSLSATSITSLLDLTSQDAEGNRDEDLCLADCRSVNKSEATEPLSNKPTCSPFPAQEVAKTQDHICPQPVPEEMLRGWWRISDVENLNNLVKALHCRGIRERMLQKQIQMNMEHIIWIYANRTDEFDTKDSEMQKISREVFEDWCVEQRAMEVDTSFLLQVEALEKNIISANLHVQVQGWMPCEPQSAREDLVYFEHKPPFSILEIKKQSETQQDNLPGFIMRRSNNPLDIAVTKLAELGRNIERSNKEEVAAGIRQWHKALGEVRSSAQLSLCIQHLQKSLLLKHDIINMHCQVCQQGNNEELLLLCNGCNKRCHTFCYNPKITTVPTGEWFCSFCGSGQTPPIGKQQSQTAGGRQKGSEVKQNGKPSAMGELLSECVASSNNMPKRRAKEFKRRKGEDSSQPKFESPVSCAKRAEKPQDSTNELAVCRMLLAELEAHQDAWPFLSPVQHKSVPGYRQVIKKPMDFSTIKEKLINNLYLNLETFMIDVNLVFDNCQRFNEDHSEIGQAGYRMRRFFDKRWTKLLDKRTSAPWTQQ